MQTNGTTEAKWSSNSGTHDGDRAGDQPPAEHQAPSDRRADPRR
jgi:hypothetical protein